MNHVHVVCEWMIRCGPGPCLALLECAGAALSGVGAGKVPEFQVARKLEEVGMMRLH
jgi:hypothetical protein